MEISESEPEGGKPGDGEIVEHVLDPVICTIGVVEFEECLNMEGFHVVHSFLRSLFVNHEGELKAKFKQFILERIDLETKVISICKFGVFVVRLARILT